MESAFGFTGSGCPGGATGMFSMPTRLRAPEQRGRASTGTNWRADGATSPTMSSRHSVGDGLGLRFRSEKERDRERGHHCAAAPTLASPPPTPGAGGDCTGGSSSGEGRAAASVAGHIRVAVRVRPLPAGDDGIIEVAGTGAIAIRKEAATGGNQFLSTQQGRIEERTFDHVFGPAATQKEVYTQICSPLVSEAVANGRSATVFVYGATGAGKTHTMFGNQEPDKRGIIFRAIPEVFRCLKEAHSGSSRSFEVKVSFLEIYNEVVRDLLQQQPLQDGSSSSSCRVLEDAQRGVVKVSNLVEAPVRNPDEALWYLQLGMQARTVEATAANSQSSRAHAVFSLTIETVRTSSQGHGPFNRRHAQVRTLHSKISLIDLAGSERAALTQNTGLALKDGARINQSLLALANCIDALTQRGPLGSATPRKKPPYRDSKLTLMLKGSLTGDGLVAMIANVHPGRSHFEDSNNTLEYAKRASVVRAPPARRLSRVQSAGIPAPTWGQQQAQQPPQAEIAALPREVADDETTCGMATSSSSSLPPPGFSREGAVGDGGDFSCLGSRHHFDLASCSRPQPGSSAEPTTASSPEECLSEISLSLGAADGDGTDCGGSESCSSRRCGGANASRDGSGKSSPEGCDGNAPVLLQDEVVGGGNYEGSMGDAGHSSGGAFSFAPQDIDTVAMGMEADTEGAVPAGGGKATHSGRVVPGEVPSPTRRRKWTSGKTAGVEASATPSLAAQIVATLQAEKAQLHAQLSGVIRERDALLRDRQQLEEENERLRAASMEKDQQLAQLLTRCGDD